MRLKTTELPGEFKPAPVDARLDRAFRQPEPLGDLLIRKLLQVTQHDSLAHVQLAHPADVARIGQDRLYVAFTYSWGAASRDYDLTVIPFIDKVFGNRFADLYPKNGYYATHVYPFAAVKAAGGVLVAGSDAPVGTWDPKPFENMPFASFSPGA